MNTSLPILSIILGLLPVFALLLWIAPERFSRQIALIGIAINLALSLLLTYRFNPKDGGFQFVEHFEWMPTLNIEFLIGVDGLSVLFIPAILLLFMAVVVTSWTSIRTMPRLYYSLILLLAATIIGIFIALDTILFFFFWELTLVPTYFLVTLWGIGPNRRFAAGKYTLVMLVGGIPLLFGILILAHDPAHSELLHFSYTTLLEQNLSLEQQRWIFLLLLFGFAFKVPLIPLHTWLPTLLLEGPVAIAMIITGLKLGAYGILRFAIPLAPDAAQEMHWLIAGLGVATLIYGAVAAIGQSNLRLMLAYASVSHVGLVILGLASFSITAIQGAAFQLLNFTILSSGTLLLVGALHHRTGSTDQINLGGVVHRMPLLTAFFFLFGIASMGIPPTSGFAAEFLLLLASLESHTGAGLAALFAVVLGAVYFLTLFRRIFFGEVRSGVIDASTDIGWRELSIVIVLASLVIGAGLFPNLVLNTNFAAATQWVQHLN